MSFTESLEDLIARSPDGRVGIHRSWKRVKLSEVVKVLNGFPFASEKFNSAKGFPLIRIRDIQRGKTDTLFDGDFDKSYVVKTGDFLVGMDGDFQCGFWRGPPALLNQRVCKLIADESKIDSHFLAYSLPGYLNLINRNTPSITVKHLSSRTIQDIPLPFPPIDAQRDIASKVEELFSDLDAGVAGLERTRAKLKRYRASVLKAAVEGRLTEKWRAEQKAKGIAVEPAAKLLDRILAERRKNWEAAQLKKFADSGKPPPKGWEKKHPVPALVDSASEVTLPESWCWAHIEQLIEPEKHALKAGPFGSALKKSFYVPTGFKIYGQEQVIRGDPYFGDYFISEEK